MDNPAQMTDMEVRERVIKLEAIIRSREELINNAVSSRIAELERHIRDIEKPQFWMSEGNDYNGGSFCCNHCNFSSPKFADRDEHIKSCVGREEYLSGKGQE